VKMEQGKGSGRGEGGFYRQGGRTNCGGGSGGSKKKKAGGEASTINAGITDRRSGTYTRPLCREGV